MDGFWEKISSYNIFNNLLPGALFIYFLEKSFQISLSGTDIVKSLVLYYFIGLIISRVGSIFVEPLLKLFRLVRFRPYTDYISACKIDQKIELLQEIANMYRTFRTMSLLLCAAFYSMEMLTGKNLGLSKYLSVFCIESLIKSYIKQVGFIVKRIDVI